MVLRELQHQAKQRGVRTLVGLYLPTARNGMVAEHYPGLGFEPAGPACDGGTRWTLDVDTDVPSAPMKVVRQDAVQAAMA
jgi:predicted enzyme involved in methoxymalonyl-ACP biosynthesis